MGELGVPLSDTLPESVDVVIDFSLPESTLRNLEVAAGLGVMVVPAIVSTAVPAGATLVDIDHPDLRLVSRYERAGNGETPGTAWDLDDEDWFLGLSVGSDLNQGEERAANSDLLMLGLQRLGRRQKVFGDMVLEIAQHTECPVLMISRRS